MITVGENTKRKYLLLFGVGVFIPLNKKLRKNSILFGFLEGGEQACSLNLVQNYMEKIL